MFKLCTNKNHSYKHNEQINNQNIDNSECFSVKFVEIYPEMFLEMGLYRSRIEFLVMFEVVQHCL
jgi:hypothetical protein